MVALKEKGRSIAPTLFEAKAAGRKNRLAQPDKKNWMAAQSSYRRKVRRLLMIWM
jgi:hypothetical protein